MNFYSNEPLISTYKYNISCQSKLVQDCNEGQVQEVHPLYPESKLPIKEFKITGLNTSQTIFETNNFLSAGKPITFNTTGTISFTVANTPIEYKFYFGNYDSVSAPEPVDTNEFSLRRRYFVDEYSFLDTQKDPAKQYVGVYYAPAESYSALCDEINASISEYARCYFSDSDVKFRLEFLFKHADLIFNNTPFSAWLGFTVQSVNVAQIQTPFLVQATSQPSNLRELYLQKLPINNVNVVVSEMTRQLSGVELASTDIELKVETSVGVKSMNLPSHIDRQTIKEALEYLDLLVIVRDITFLLSHKLGKVFRLRTSLSISEFFVNHTGFANTHTLKHNLPELSLQRRLRFFLDDRKLLHVQTTKTSFDADIDLAMFGGYLKLRNGANLALTGTLNADKTKVTLNQDIGSIFGTEKQIVVLKDSAGNEMVARKSLGNEYNVVSYAPSLVGIVTLELYLKETAHIAGPQILYFNDDIMSRRVLNVHQRLHYIYADTLSTQLSSIPVCEEMKFAFYFKLLDFPLKTNWHYFGRQGFLENIVCKVFESKLASSKQLVFPSPSYIHGFKFILVDEYGKKMCCSSPIQVDIELLIGS